MIQKFSRHLYRKPNTFYSPIDLIICEGETEFDYLHEVSRMMRIHVQISLSKGTSPKNIVISALRKALSDGLPYDQIFCVFDRDHDDPSCLNAVEFCNQNNIVPVVSSPCIEVWFIMHFQHRESGYGNPAGVIKALKKMPGFPDYKKDGVHAFHSTKDHLKTACLNALKLTKNSSYHPRCDPYTNMHQLISRFQTLQKEQNYLGKLSK
jgi:hypothetical protein